MAEKKFEIPQEVYDLIDEADGSGSTTKIIQTIMAIAGASGVTMGGAVGFLENAPWQTSAAIIIGGCILGAGALYTLASRGRKSTKALAAKMALRAALK